VKYVVALGSNLGNRLAKLESAISSIGTFAEVLYVSSFIETAPVGGPEQPDYMNGVLIAESDLLPSDFLNKLHDIENAAGRTREVRWGARTLDLDIIVAGDIIQDDQKLTLPHPRAHERAFVLQPWLEIEPDAVIPGRGSVEAILAALLAQE
jgi:2-amino-4-hydroxy-6-hydroxymethyldihydropteridine diphosphokinase